MSLMEDIEKEINKKPKWRKLKDIEKEINEMIDNRISLKKQIELILKNGIVEKLDLAEYRKILVKYFDYTGKKPKIRYFEKPKDKELKKEKLKQPKNEKRESAIDILSKDIDLLELNS